MHKRRLWADLALLLVAFIWGVAFVVQRVAAAEVQAFVFNGVRFLLGALVILPFASIQARRRAESGEMNWNLNSLSGRKYLPGVLLAGRPVAGRRCGIPTDWHKIHHCQQCWFYHRAICGFDPDLPDLRRSPEDTQAGGLDSRGFIRLGPVLVE